MQRSPTYVTPVAACALVPVGIPCSCFMNFAVQAQHLLEIGNITESDFEAIWAAINATVEGNTYGVVYLPLLS